LGSSPLGKREFAGRAFHNKVEAALHTPEPSVEDPAASDDSRMTPEKKAGGKKKKRQVECIILDDDLKEQDLYKLLGADECASEKEMKDAYKKVVLRSHPDKLGREPTEKEKAKFLLIQKAYDILQDSKKRQQYDSSRPFDDATPSSFNPRGQDFYKVFAEVFQRNSRFSVRKPVPQLGDASTEVDEVKNFYNFWGCYESWRDPLADAQMNGEEVLDLTEAEDRWQRRQMEAENGRIAKRYKKMERQRVSEMVELARENDPRLIADLAARKAAKEAGANAKKAAAEKEAREASEAAEAARLTEEAEKERLTIERTAKKAAREAAKKEREDATEGVMNAVLGYGKVEFKICEHQLERLAKSFDVAACNALTASVKAWSESEAALIKMIQSTMRENDIEPRMGDITPSRILDEENAKRKESKGKKGKANKEPVKETNAERKERELREVKQAQDQKKKQEERAKKEKAANEKREKADRKAEEKRIADELKADEDKLKRDEESRIKAIEAKEAKATKDAAKKQDKADADVAKTAELNAIRVRGLYEEFAQELIELWEAEEKTLATVELARPVEGALGKLKAMGDTDEACDRALLILRSNGYKYLDLGFVAPGDIKVQSTIRNKLKKVRTNMRKVVMEIVAKSKTGNFPSELKRIVNGEVPAESTFEIPEAGETPAAAPEAAASSNKKKKAKKADDDDLDALLAEFGVDTTSKKKKNNKK